MSLEENKLKSYKKLIDEVEELNDKKKDIKKTDDSKLLSYLFDLDSKLFSSEVVENMLEVSEAFRLTIMQLIDQEIGKKADLLSKIKLRNDE
jgi:hypothetical protein